MKRYFFEIAYQGTNYHGWQIQPNAISVQEVVNDCLAKITGNEVNVVGSGRTDTGVHCKQQYFHQDLKTSLSRDDLRYKLNSMLPFDISIQSVSEVLPEAHARFDAISRSYEYHINRSKDPFRKVHAYYFSKPLNIQNMNGAAALLCGNEKNFEALSRVKTEVNNFNCKIEQAFWVESDQGLVFHITANRFLRGMVRAAVGTLLDIGEGKRTVPDMLRILESRDRREAGRAAPAHGLYLSEVRYPDHIFI